MQHKKYGEIDVIEIPGDPEGPAIVMFHGFGANSADLAGLAQAVKVPAGTNWYFPNGILDLAPMAGMVGMPGFQGRAWWPIDQKALDYAMARGTHRDLSGFVPEGVDELRAKVSAMLKAIGKPLSRTTLGGFSQGAMLATDMTLHADESPAGLAILSGSLIDEATWRSLASKRGGMQFFQSHGTSDPLLDFQAARNLEQLLREGGLTGEFVSFDGAHEIPPQVVARLSQYLRR